MGDAPASAAGQGNLVLTPATVGNTFVFDVRAENNGNQTLTHAQLALGVAPAPDLPAGLWIVDATTDDPGCPTVTQPTRTFLCELGNFGAGDTVEVKFRMRADAPLPRPPKTRNEARTTAMAYSGWPRNSVRRCMNAISMKRNARPIDPK